MNFFNIYARKSTGIKKNSVRIEVHSDQIYALRFTLTKNRWIQLYRLPPPPKKKPGIATRTCIPNKNNIFKNKK